MGPTRTAAALLAVLKLSACAKPSDAPPPTSLQLPADHEAPVLRVEHVGGFVTPEWTLTRLPPFSLYADGRLITQGPVPAVHPGPALPNVLVQSVDAGTVQALVEQALAAGVAETADLGTLDLADVPSTRFTLVTSDGVHVREVHALIQGAFRGAHDELSVDQRAGRAALRMLEDTLDGLSQQQPWPEGYAATSVVAIARPWTAPREPPGRMLARAPVPWPGPPLPGEPVGVQDLGCVTATGDQAAAVLTVARQANGLTRWETPDGALWSVTFRPLLPDESSCADLLR